MTDWSFRDGKLVAEITSNTETDMIKARILTTLASQSVASSAGLASDVRSAPLQTPETSNASASNETTTATTQSASEPDSSIHETQTASEIARSEPQERRADATVGPSDALTSMNRSSTVQSLLDERRRRLERDKQVKEAAEKAERKAKAEASKNSMTEEPNSAKAKQATYAQEQRKRQQQEKVHREQVLRQIESDKAERKEREERRKALAKAEASSGVGAGESSESSVSNKQPANDTKAPVSARAASSPCAVQVRLLDGSLIRTKFDSKESLTAVRDWVDQERSDDIPYTFKQILSPLPNKPLSITEEKETLRDLRFIPSATLVTVPVQGYTAAYSDANPGIVSRGLTAGYNTVAAGAGIVSGVLGTFLGIGRVATQPQAKSEESPSPPQPQSQPATNRSGINVRTLRDQRESRDEHQLYNGNQACYFSKRCLAILLADHMSAQFRTS